MKPINESYLCGTAKEPLLYETIGGCLDRIAAEHPDADALIVRHQGVRWKYAEYKEKVGACCRSAQSRY